MAALATTRRALASFRHDEVSVVRTYKWTGAYLKWTSEQLNLASKAVLECRLSVRAAAVHFSIPYETLRRSVYTERLRQSYSEHHLQEYLSSKKIIGHPTVLSDEQEKELVLRLINLSNRGLGCDSKGVRHAVYKYVVSNSIKHPWGESGIAGKDWFLSFMKIHPELSLRKPEGLSKARAAGVNRCAVNDFYSLLQTTTLKIGVNCKPQNIYNVDESGLPMNNRPVKVVAPKGKREVTSITSLERGENVTIVAACSASGQYIPPMVIFKGVRFRQEYDEHMPSGTVVKMSESGYINEEIFLFWLKHFNVFRVPGKCLLVLDGHSSHCSLECLEFCEQNDIELLCLPPHTTHVLQPMDRTVFKTLKTHYHAEATQYIHSQPGGKISKFNFGELFKKAWHRTATPALAEKGFQCTGIHPYNPEIVPEEKFLPSTLFYTQQEPPGLESSIPSTPLSGESASTHKDRDSSEISTVTLTTKQLSSKSPDFSQIISTPVKTNSNKKQGSRKQKSRLLTSKDNISDCRAKRQIKLLKGQPCKKLKKNSSARSVHCPAEDLREISTNSSSEDDPNEVSMHCEGTDNTPCGFCSLRYNSLESLKKGDWIACQQCARWYHEVCVGAVGQKMFVCGKCI